MAFRERIEAILQAKDVQRFKAGMKTAARSVKDLGREGEKTSAELEVLEQIEEKLGHQTEQLTAIVELAQRAVDELGDEAVGTAAQLRLLDREQRRVGGSLGFMGKRWSFWKDRLSITADEIKSTAATITTYLSPALLAVGTNLAQASLGLGAVGLAGGASFGFGLGGLGLIGAGVARDIGKIKSAQDQLLLTQEQYGKSSQQASAANAHLYATIQRFGGAEAAHALSNIERFSDAWKDITAPARASVFRIISKGLSAGRRLLPTVGEQINRGGRATESALSGAFKRLSGSGGQRFFRVLGRTFSRSIGPVVRGLTSFLIIVGRVIEAAAPYVVIWAKAWESIAASWEKGTRNTGPLKRFIDDSVRQFGKWVDLGKELWRTITILFGPLSDLGGKILPAITGELSKFNDWLEKLKGKSLNELLFGETLRPGAVIFDYVTSLVATVGSYFWDHKKELAKSFYDALFDADTWKSLLVGGGALALLKKTVGLAVGFALPKGGLLGGKAGVINITAGVVNVVGGGGVPGKKGLPGRVTDVFKKFGVKGAAAAGLAYKYRGLIAGGASAATALAFITYLATKYNKNLPTRGPGASSPSSPEGHVPFRPGAPQRMPFDRSDVYRGWGGDPKPLKFPDQHIHVHVEVDKREIARANTRFNANEAARAGGFRHQRSINEY